MARQRRGGFRPPELRGTLGTLLRTTLEQAGVVRDALERGARSGRSRLDEAFAHRRRKDALADLGQLVLDLIRRGEIDLAELPEAHDLVRSLDDLDSGDPADPDDRIAQPPTRHRFDARSGDSPRSRDVAPDDSHPPEPPRARSRSPHDDHDRARDRSDDGTVSALRSPRGSSPSSTSSRWSPPRPSSPQRVWRPSLVDEVPPPEPRGSRDAPAPRGAPAPRDFRDAPTPRDPLSARSLPRDPAPKGGIQFDDDDLADYMHPDDVPPKPPTDDDH